MEKSAASNGKKAPAIRPMTATDLLKFNQCNLDHLTETYNIGFYLEYFTKWPQLCKVIENPRTKKVEAYILGKLEASPYKEPISPYNPGVALYQTKFANYLPWHAHITCLTVAPAARRQGYATLLSEALEVVGDEADAWFVDLFVRVENEAAIKLYEKMGYSVYRRVVDYYNGGSDAFDMRKPLAKDKKKQTVRANGKDVKVKPEDVCGDKEAEHEGQRLKNLVQGSIKQAEGFEKKYRLRNGTA